ncbi:membrane protein [Micractinium conductrix]|uniref:Membrane protein n=1 Tax=Micractinium conductrix TaxID=554055 RepID=A0A2P6V1R5_9CHLO|nr:membrane protein [Micractinium conductrix]PSC69514.1 membrane protein [Micractinium conductrix]|eukprot:PSC68036.1 membrane protein [Micractinium conductrix]
MYDFCFTPIYAALLALGGFVGYATKGSTASLGGGLGSAVVLAGCTWASLNAFHRGQLCRPATLLSLAVSACLTYLMWQRLQRTGKVMPAGMVASLSAAMSLFYVWNLLLFKPNLPASKQH